jgi:hypothetical protein
MRLIAVVVAGALLCPALIAQTEPQEPAPPPEPAPVTTVVIPVVGSVVGANGVRWKTDLELYNSESNDVTVAIELAVDPDKVLLMPMASGQGVRFLDVIGEAFGTDGVMSPILVRTSGRRSVSIRATAYGVRGAETFRPQPITINYGPAFAPVRVLNGLSFSDELRTNIGLVNLSSDDVDFTLALQRIPGRNLAVRRVRVPRTALWHFNIQTAFPMITKGDRFTIVIETSAPDTYVYASVIENSTNTARFVDPLFGAPPPPTRR